MRVGDGVPRILSAAVMLLVALVPHAPPTLAYHEGQIRSGGSGVNETISLPSQNWTAFRMFVRDTERIDYEVRVTSGGAIDLYAIAENQFSSTRATPRSFSMFSTSG